MNTEHTTSKILIDHKHLLSKCLSYRLNSSLGVEKRFCRITLCCNKIFLYDDLVKIGVFNSTFVADSRCNIIFFLTHQTFLQIHYLLLSFYYFMYCFYDFYGKIYDSTTEKYILISHISYKPVYMTMY